MKVYKTPDIEVLRLSETDIIRTSVGTETPIVDTEDRIIE